MKFVYILLISILSTSVNSAAVKIIDFNFSRTFSEKDSTNTSPQELEEKDKKFLKFGNLFYMNSGISFNNNFLESGYYLNPNFIVPNFDVKITDIESQLSESKVQLFKALKMNFNIIKRNDPGTFGKILGGAVGISAVGLGIYHLIKYKDEYFK